MNIFQLLDLPEFLPEIWQADHHLHQVRDADLPGLPFALRLQDGQELHIVGVGDPLHQSICWLPDDLAVVVD
eukprot:3256859-Heterocapsa_arctica.AAC.1